MAFNDWKIEKAVTALIDEAQAMAERLSSAKPHQRDSHAAHTRLWQATYLAEGKDLHTLSLWPAAEVTRFARAAQTKIAALHKARDYDSSDGLAVWLHTARAVTEPRIALPVREIWQLLLSDSPNVDSMTDELLAEANLAPAPFAAPAGFDTPA